MGTGTSDLLELSKFQDTVMSKSKYKQCQHVNRHGVLWTCTQFADLTVKP